MLAIILTVVTKLKNYSRSQAQTVISLNKW